jgi:hypothetical protein
MAAAAEGDARLRESERIARKFQQNGIRRLFGISMGVSAAINRHPALAGPLRETVRELDGVIHDLRVATFGLAPGPQARLGARARIAEAVERAESEFGLRVTTGFAGPVDRLLPPDVVDEIVSGLPDAIRQIAEAGVGDAGLVVAADHDGDGAVVTIRLRVRMSAPAEGWALARRAGRRGSCSVTADGSGWAVVDWRMRTAVGTVEPPDKPSIT